jgi:hypothetical protein
LINFRVVAGTDIASGGEQEANSQCARCEAVGSF